MSLSFQEGYLQRAKIDRDRDAQQRTGFHNPPYSFKKLDGLGNMLQDIDHHECFCIHFPTGLRLIKKRPYTLFEECSKSQMLCTLQSGTLVKSSEIIKP